MQALAFATPPEQTVAAESWTGNDRSFSRKMGERGWLGMTWPKRYGGHERTALERYVVLEEMLAAGAPVGYHWVADRQSGPSILKNGTEAQRQEILPKIAAGECSFCIGMSEPDSGSDLAAARTRAQRVQGGWLVSGTKVWTSSAHVADYMILFCRTGDKSADDRHAGASQFVVDMRKARDGGGMTVRPIIDMTGGHHFNEVILDDMLLPEDALLGQEGDGWKQVTGELAFERSGPDRFLSSFALLVEAVRALGPDADDRAAAAIGRLTSHILALRRLSRSIAGMLQAGEDPALQASLVKDLGNVLEQETVEVVRLLVDVEPSMNGTGPLPAVLAHLVMTAPSFSLRGGTREILRGIIARGLGLR
jgi:alkylation response protein AidB-like acyl-CoA dehydrogenase